MTQFKQGWPLKIISARESSPELRGVHVFLQTPNVSHYKEWSTLREKNKEFLTPYEPKWAQNGLTLGFYKKRLARQKIERQAGRGAFFFIFEKNTNELIGGINLNNIQYGAAYHASLGYWLGEDFQRQGYMAEALSLMKMYAFNGLNLKRLNAACLPDNERSVRLLEKAGFTEEGYAPKYLQINGVWQDHRLFGLLNHEN